MPRSRLWYCIDAGFGSGVGSCFVLATVFNGVGQTEYPVVFIQYGDVVERTVLVQLGLFAVFEAVLSMMFACLGVCVYAGSRNRAISSMVIALVGA